MAKEHSDDGEFDAEGFSAAVAIALAKATRAKRAGKSDKPSASEVRHYHQLADAKRSGKATPSERARLKALESKFDDLESQNAPFDKLASAAIDDIDRILKYHGIED